MPEQSNFQDKIMDLNSKILNLQRGPSNFDKISKHQENFLKTKTTVDTKLKNLEKQLNFFEQKVKKYQEKIKRQKVTVDTFSTQKHQNLTEIIQQWVQEYQNNLQRAKNNLKTFQVAVEVKMAENQKENSILIRSLTEKVQQNLKKARFELHSFSTDCQSEGNNVKEELAKNRVQVTELLKKREKGMVLMQNEGKAKIEHINCRLDKQIEIISQKWSKKDKKTKQIFEILADQI